jgi:hypothetical protein
MAFKMPNYCSDALLVAANLARYKGGEFMSMFDKWKSFLGGHHFIDLPPDCTPFEADQKRMVFNGKRQVVYVIRIGREGDLSPLKFESQLQMDRLPPESILSDFNNRNFVGTQSLLLRTCMLTCLLVARRTAFLRPHRQIIGTADGFI